MHVGRYWEKVGDKTQCNICPRHCKLSEGQRGFCFVRQNVDDQIVLTTYGRSSGFCIDPIEKKPLNHFYPGTSVLSFGTAGCNLGCKFCQNWDISKAKQMDRLMNQASPMTIAQVAKKHKCKSVAFTYNDPVIFLEYAVDTAKQCHELGVKTVAVTAGYITKQARKEFFSHLDATNIDLKAFTQHFYRKLCFADLRDVLNTIKYVHDETDVWMEITNLVIPQNNDDLEEFKRMSQWILDNVGDQVPVHFSAFHPDYKMMDLPRTPAHTLSNARNVAKQLGLKYVYTGNVHDQDGDTTYCGGCGVELIIRDWYDLKSYKMNMNRCRVCDHEIAGHFDVTPGNWGKKRVRLKMS
jgi:pyruvate formate lyase activating enzyme